MNAAKDPDEDFSSLTHLYKNKGKKFWNANVREHGNKQLQKPVTKAATSKSKKVQEDAEDDNDIAERKIKEIVELRGTSVWCFKYAPNCILVTLFFEEDPILKELTSLGYYQVDRCQGLTLEEAKLVLSELAKVHANHYRLKPTDKQRLKYRERRAYRVPDATKSIAYAAIIAAKTNIPNFDQLANKAKKIVDKFDNKMQDVLLCNKIRVINHGDAWLNNVFFKQENGVLKDTILLKSEFMRYLSLGLDLNFFLHTSLQIDVLKTHREELLWFYHKSLCKCMFALWHWSVPPTWNAVLDAVHSCEFYSFYTVLCELPIACLPRHELIPLSWRWSSCEAFGEKCCSKDFQCSRVLETIQYTLERLDELGKLD